MLICSFFTTDNILVFFYVFFTFCFDRQALVMTTSTSVLTPTKKDNRTIAPCASSFSEPRGQSWPIV